MGWSAAELQAKNGQWQLVCTNVFALEWSHGLRAMIWISARPRPYNVDGLVKTFSDIRFRERGRDPLPSLFSASRPGRNPFSLIRDFKLSPQEPERDSVRSC